jgi:hypothetical protein
VDEHRVSVPTNLFRGGDERVGGEVGAGEDEVVLLGGERLAEHDGVDPGDLAGAGGQLRHGLDVAELVGGSARRRLLAVGRAHGGGGWRGDGERGREGGSSEIRAGAGGVSDGYRWTLSLYKRW